MAKVPPGFRFHPTDVELVLYYLKRKVLGKPLHVQAITELDLYKFSPWDLPGKSCMRSGDREWFFFCPRDRKYANGPRLNRASAVGYWKTTGRDRAICNDSQTVGMKRTLIFHLGRAPKGDRTNWVMHEYRLEIKDLAETGIQQAKSGQVNEGRSFVHGHSSLASALCSVVPVPQSDAWIHMFFAKSLRKVAQDQEMA
ncbi:hypothetical protein IFM89_001788 [Coptis chinensis]|uniref:NAC domain-containing protein n=1 Tax=Coptis chinensis TaxID=261450 RepID=A0A835LPA3_9MAGN|nr:hypothetical protein IFM89_001788 [Coptis chinensis]